MKDSFNINDALALDRAGFEIWMDLVADRGLDAAMRYRGAPAYLCFFLEQLVDLFDDCWFSISDCIEVMSRAIGHEPQKGEPERVSQMFHALRGVEIGGAGLITSASSEPLWRVAPIGPNTPTPGGTYLH